jgi:hypothetical protein
MPSDNFEKLRRAEVILADEVPREYDNVIEGLTPQEVDVLIAVKRRLEAADECAGVGPPAKGEPPQYMSFVRF